MEWREALDPLLQEHLQGLLKKVYKEEMAYRSALHKEHAQFWCAFAVLMKEISNLQIRMKALEKGTKRKENTRLKKELEKL